MEEEDLTRYNLIFACTWEQFRLGCHIIPELEEDDTILYIGYIAWADRHGGLCISEELLTLLRGPINWSKPFN